MTVSIDLGAADLCQSEGPVLVGKDGKPIWLDTSALIKRATHCVAPQMPALYRQVRLEGQVQVDILVGNNGRVACARLVHGHPLVAASAIDAAKDWTFRPMTQGGKTVSFYGHLSFSFSTSSMRKEESPCAVAH